MKTVYLKKSTSPGKKWMVYVDPPGKTIHFGAKGMSDYTKHKNAKRMKRYSGRHKKRENWNCSGITTAGFWSKGLLWNKPSIGGSKRSLAKKCGIRFKSGWPKKGSRSRSRSKRKSKRRSRRKRRSRKRKSRKSRRKSKRRSRRRSRSRK